jgi:hypothetical protein
MRPPGVGLCRLLSDDPASAPAGSPQPNWKIADKTGVVCQVGKIVGLAFAEQGDDGRGVLPRWLVRTLGLDKGVWEIVAASPGRAVLRRVASAPPRWKGRSHPEPAA